MTEKIKKYMDFMGPTRPRLRKTSGIDPLMARPASASNPNFSKSPTRLSSSKTSVNSIKPRSSSPKSTPKPSPKTKISSKPTQSVNLPPLETSPSPSSGTFHNTSPSPSTDITNPTKDSNEAPDGNNFSLGGKSPFLSSYNIEKRPLGDSVKEKKVEEISKKNIYKREEPSKKSSKKSPTIVIDEPKKSSSLTTIIIIILTIILGVAVGVGIYFLLPK